MNEVTNDYGLPSRVLEHVFLGEIKSGYPTGFHCNRDLGDENAEVLPETKAVISGDIFEYKVRSKSTYSLKRGNGGYSTFFPETWSRQDVLDAISNRTIQLVDSTSSTYVFNDIRVKIIEKNGNIITFYPIRRE